MNFQDLFKLAMKRDLPDLIDLEGEGRSIDIGASGTYRVKGTHALGLPFRKTKSVRSLNPIGSAGAYVD